MSSSYCAYAYICMTIRSRDCPICQIRTIAATVALPIPAGYAGFDPATAPNDGAGFAKNLGGNSLPNAPPYTVSFGAQYSMPLTTDWAAHVARRFLLAGCFVVARVQRSLL